MLYLNISLGLSCSDFDAIPMTYDKQEYRYLTNPSICFPKSCGNHCNECYTSALEPNTCSITNGNMCYQGNGGPWSIPGSLAIPYKCCANHVPQDRMCWGKIEPPCRLREQN